MKERRKSIIKIERKVFNMKNNNCSDCSEKSVEGRAYIDKETGLLCVDLTNNKMPETDKDILVPYVCTTCGETTWKTKSKVEEDK